MQRQSAPAPRVLSGAELPVRLRDLPEPPRSLYVWGELPLEPAVAIVGSRRATRAACGFARRIAKELAQQGVTILSGGAHGIDTAAHEGALLGGGRTVVVAPASLEEAYPKENLQLFHQILDAGGGYVALHDRRVTLASFFQRNAVLAALCHVLVIGEAMSRSGARNAAKCARTLGRPVFAVPAAGWNQKGRGSNAELRAGAQFLESSKEVLQCLAAMSLVLGSPEAPRSVAPQRAKRRRPRSASPQLSLQGVAEEEALPPEASSTERVAFAIRRGIGDVEDLCTETGLSVQDVQVAVFELQLAQKVAEDGRGLLGWVGPVPGFTRAR